jgi:hypothetical protein
MIENIIILAISVLIYIELENLVARILVSIHEMATQPNMILNGYGNFIEKRLGAYWSKPFFRCPACMVSVYWIIPVIIGGIIMALTVSPLGLLAIPSAIISGFSISLKATQIAVNLKDKRNRTLLSEHEIKEQEYERLV